MAEDEDTTDTAAPTPPASETAPQWAIDLKNAIEGLPGKLQATVTDSDKSGIAEAVHGLFEKSGAFESGDNKDKEQTTDEADEDKPDDQEEQKPDKKGLSGFAAWFEGKS